jgi:CRISPR-associated endoribonuclease Cas6
MIKKVSLTLKSQSQEQPNIFWGYNLYGALMQKINPDYAEYLHNEGLKPINQYLLPHKTDDGKTAVWHINLLGQEAIENTLPIFETLTEININNHNTVLKVENIQISETVTEEQLLNNYLCELSANNKININYITPCSFKSNNQYVIFPTAELIIKSAIQKWNAYSTQAIIDDEDALLQLIEQTRIDRYSLKSFIYHVKGTMIPSFTGYTTLAIKGPLPMVRLFNLLMHFLEYSGLGIKTTLGMGGCIPQDLK